MPVAGICPASQSANDLRVAATRRTCINESKESLTGVDDGVGAGEVAFACAGLGCAFFGVASMRVEGACSSEMSVRPFFFGSALAGACSNLPCTMIPDSRLVTM